MNSRLMPNCIFCKIGAGEVPSEKVFEDADVIAFADIRPKAPVHLLIVPKTHIPSLKELGVNGAELVWKMVLRAVMLAGQKQLDGYKLVFNVGRAGGQIIDHLHLHLMGGWESPPGKVEV